MLALRPIHLTLLRGGSHVRFVPGAPEYGLCAIAVTHKSVDNPVYNWLNKFKTCTQIGTLSCLLLSASGSTVVPLSARMHMDHKYRLVRTSDAPRGLYRIVATRSFGEVTEGELGGFVESARNLSQDGDCWVHDDACVRGEAVVQDASHVYQDAQVFDRAIVGGCSILSGSAWVFGDAVVEDSTVAGWAWVCNRASVRASRVERGATVYGRAKINDLLVSGRATVGGVVVIDHGMATLPNGDICWRDMLEIFRSGRQWAVSGESTLMGDTCLTLAPELGSWFGESGRRTMLPERLREQEMLDDEAAFFARMELYLTDPL